MAREGSRSGWQALTELAESARSLDVRAFEGRDVLACKRELVPDVDDLLQQAIEVASALSDRFDTPSGTPTGEDSQRQSMRPHTASVGPSGPVSVRRSTHFHTQIDALVGDASRGPALVADIAFVAGMELREKRQRLARALARQAEDHWELVEACASARRRVLKSATALELVLSEVEGRAPKLDYRTERGAALEVRRRYAALRATIAADDPPGEDALLGRLRVVGTRIAMLVGLDVYPDLRLRDRVEMRSLQRRILEWLSGPRESREGMRLWGDLVGFADLIAQVSKRQELVEHDGELLERQLPVLEAMQADALVDDALYKTLVDLRGASKDVDSLLECDERRAGAWVGALRALAEGAAAAAQPSGETRPDPTVFWDGSVPRGVDR